MKYPLRWLLPLCLLGGMLLTLSSCVYEDMSECPKPQIRFVYKADGTDNVLPSYIASAQLYIYDESGRLRHELQLSRRDLTEGMSLDGGFFPHLDLGRYHLVAWANMTSSASQVTAPESVATSALSVRTDDKKLYRTSDSLYCAEVLLDIEPGKPDSYEIPFASAHIGLDLLVEGFEHVFPDGELLVTIDKAGVAYDLAALRATGETLQLPQIGIPLPTRYDTYTPHTVRSERYDLYRSRFDLLRFTDDSDVAIVLTNTRTGEVIRRIPLRDYLKEKKISVNTWQEANIALRIILAHIGGTLEVTIKPFEWGTVDIKPDSYK